MGDEEGLGFGEKGKDADGGKEEGRKRGCGSEGRDGGGGGDDGGG